MEVSELDSELQAIKSKVDTSPLKRGGANFKTNVLIQESASKLVYKPSTGVAFFCFLFFAVGLTVLFFSFYASLGNDSDSVAVNWFLLIFGLIFATAGGFMFYFFYMPRVFDKQLGIYYKAYQPEIRDRKKSTSTQIPLKSIVAIQIIGEIVRSNDGSYKSFELNLVLNDSSRKNVVDHGNLKYIIIDAEIISEFLNVPIWHA